MLRTFGAGTLRLVDVSSELPELRRRAGLSTWRVWYRAQWQASWDELQARFPRKCPPFESLFPPTAEEAREMHLERCMRLLPHDNDGGAARPNVVPPPSAGPVLHGSCTHASSGDAWLRAAQHSRGQRALSARASRLPSLTLTPTPHQAAASSLPSSRSLPNTHPRRACCLQP